MLDSGVDVLKIEGRGRSADYVYTTTQCYKEAINAYNEGTYTKEKIDEWKTRLDTVFNRGFWDGYYLGKEIGEWHNVDGSKATKRKVYVGKGVKYFDNVKVGEFKIETHSLAIGDEILIIGPTTGLIQTKVAELRLNDASVNMVQKGDTMSMPINEKIRPSDKLYKLVEA